MIGLIPLNEDKNFELKSLSVECRVLNLLICCTAEFVYHNGLNVDAEALFSFPLDGGCVVYYLEAIFGDKRIIGVCKETDEARNMYRAATELGQKAAIIERNRDMNDVFNCSIGNIPGQSDARIIIKFALELRLSVTESEESNVDRFNLCLPLILRPRYTPTGYKSDLEVYQVTNKYEYRFKATFTGTKVIKDISSVNHKLEINYTNDNKTHAELALLSEYDGCTDLDINIDYVNMKQPSVIYELGTESEQCPNSNEMGSFYKCGVAMVNFLPTFEKSQKEVRYEIIIIVDRSGSMMGANIEKAKECLLIFIKSLPINCKFQIYGFGSNFDKAFDTSQLYDDRSINIALTYQKNLDASFGGTELMQPLRDMYNTPLGDDYSRIAFLLTDGDVGNQDEVINLVKKHNNKTRLFTVGIGDGVSTSLVYKVAKAGFGKSTFVRNATELSASVMELLDISVNSYPFTDAKINWKCPGHVKIVAVPTTTPPIFSDYFLTIFCMIKGMKGDDKLVCTLTGKVNGKNESYSMEINNSKAIVDEEFRVHRLLGKYKIEEMTNEIDDGKEDIKKALIELSTQVNIVTEWTTFVAIDPEASKEGKIYCITDNPEMAVKPMREFLKGGMAPGRPTMMQCIVPVACSITPMAAMPCPAPPPPIPPPSIRGGQRSKGDFLKYPTPARNVILESYVFENYDERKTAVDVIIYLVDKQNINGSWFYDDEICTTIGLDTAKVNEKLPKSICKDVWLTALVYHYLLIKKQSREKEWRLFVRKAKEWIENKLNDTELTKNMMTEAEGIFH